MEKKNMTASLMSSFHRQIAWVIIYVEKCYNFQSGEPYVLIAGFWRN